MNQNTITKLISLLMTIVLILSLGCLDVASANSTTLPQYNYTDGDGFVWTYYINADSKATIVNTTMTSGDVIIPASVMHEGVSTPVTEINDPSSNMSIFGTTDVIANNTVTSVTVPEGIIHIGDEAFQHCTAMTSATIPYGVETLGIAVFFRNSSLTSIALPGSIDSIHFNTFVHSGIDSMSDITYGDRPGYTFDEWNEEPDGSGDTLASIILATSNAYAIWTPNTYTVTLNPRGGTVDPETQDYVFDTAYDALPTPVLAGRVFTGWNTAEDGSGTAITTVSVVK